MFSSNQRPIWNVNFVFKLRVYDYAKLGVFYCNALYMLTQWLSYFFNSGIFLDKDVFKIML